MLAIFTAVNFFALAHGSIQKILIAVRARRSRLQLLDGVRGATMAAIFSWIGWLIYRKTLLTGSAGTHFLSVIPGREAGRAAILNGVLIPEFGPALTAFTQHLFGIIARMTVEALGRTELSRALG
jgi:hypothetical protein